MKSRVSRQKILAVWRWKGISRHHYEYFLQEYPVFVLRRRNVISWSFLVLFCRVERKFLFKRMEKGIKNKKREGGSQGLDLWDQETLMDGKEPRREKDFHRDQEQRENLLKMFRWCFKCVYFKRNIKVSCLIEQQWKAIWFITSNDIFVVDRQARECVVPVKMVLYSFQF